MQLMWTQRPSTLLLAGLLAALPACSLCEGIEQPTTTMRVAYADAAGGAMESVVTFDGQSPPGSAGQPSSEAAIRDASSVGPAFGFVGVQSTASPPDRSLAFEVPFPLSAGQTFPISASPSANRSSFTLEAASDRTPFPTDSIEAWLQLAPSADCTRTTPDICTANLKAQRDQAWVGTVEVVAVRPLRLRINATVSYPADSGIAPQALDGVVSFDVQHGSVCRD